MKYWVKKLSVISSVRWSRLVVLPVRLSSWMISRIWVIIWLSKVVCPSTWLTFWSHLKKRRWWKKVMTKLNRLWTTITWGSLPTTNVITRLLILGHMLTASCPIHWWSSWLLIMMVSTLSIWWWILEPVVLKNRFVSCPACVVWWQNRRKVVQKVVRLLKTRSFLTLKKVCLC